MSDSENHPGLVLLRDLLPETSRRRMFVAHAAGLVGGLDEPPRPHEFATCLRHFVGEGRVVTDVEIFQVWDWVVSI